MSEWKKKMSKSLDNLFSGSCDDSLDIRIKLCVFRERVEQWTYWNVNAHTWRFYWNPAPGAVILCGEKRHPLDPGTAVLIPPYTPYATDMTCPFPHFYVHFTVPPPYDSVRREVLFFRSEGIIPPDFLHSVETLPERQFLLVVRIAVLQALLRIPDEAFLPGKDAEMHPAVRRAIDLMADELGVRHTCREISRRCGISLSRFHLLFRRETGLPMKTWLLNMRMERAAHLLLHGTTPVKEIASELAFADRYHFSKVFKSFFGEAPAAFRREGGHRPEGRFRNAAGGIPHDR